MSRSPTHDADADVAIAGAGPTGLLLAAELAMRGVRVVILERHAERPPFVRAFNLGPRSLELLDRRGIVERFLAEGRKVPYTHFAALDEPLDLSGLPTDHPYVLGIAQTRTEALLEAHALERGAELRWGHEVAGLVQDDDAVTIDARDTASSRRHVMRARWLVGCDGGRSTVRKLAGIAFPGTAATRWALLGDVELTDPDSLTYGAHETERGTVFMIPRPGYVRVIVSDPCPPSDRDRPVTLDELASAVHAVLGRDVALRNPRWLTRFGNAARIAERYRAGRVFLAGDAAHVHPPAGAQGLNVGMQDAFNLGWKLAAVVQGRATPELLDSYHAERHPAGERVLMHTRAQAELARTDAGIAPVRALLRSLARSADVRRELAEMVAGIETRYAVAAPEVMARQPWLGRLAFNAPVVSDRRVTTIAACLSDGRALLVTRGERERIASLAAEGGERVSVASVAQDAREPQWLAGSHAACIRPDGHIAWLAAEKGDCPAWLPDPFRGVAQPVAAISP